MSCCLQDLKDLHLEKKKKKKKKVIDIEKLMPSTAEVTPDVSVGM